MDKITSTARLMDAEELAQRQAGEASFLQLPARGSVFAERSMRLRQLASGHAMGEFLQFMAELADAQQRALASFPVVPLPDGEALMQASRLGMPPLPGERWPRDPAWQQCLRQIATEVLPKAPEAGREVLQDLTQADGEWLEQQADKLLHGVMQGLDMAAAPIIASALQVYWTHLVIAVQEQGAPAGLAEPFGRVDDATACPCCGSRPTASVVKAGAERGGQRYLHCSLCSTQWHMVRIKCTHCESTKGLVYESMAPVDATEEESKGREPVVQAEACSECGHYLKLVHADRDVMAEPVADDLATLTLDLLVAETGLQRHGVNLLLLFGESEEPAPDPELQ
ncbi:MAG: formate dehydrogenase accessory protein FdhE [Pseudomonadota bacterium]|jgi:FdhE protein|uniref:formate dehydrogenase accessory protein FdhE n=1 Tax=Brachymonas denitrificans TaxID=28220 RepID=UPI00321FA523